MPVAECRPTDRGYLNGNNPLVGRQMRTDSAHHIVADANRKREFEDKINASIFDGIRKRVNFLEYTRVAAAHMGLARTSASIW